MDHISYIFSGDFPSGPVVKTLHFQGKGTEVIPGWETKIPYAVQATPKKKKKDVQYIYLAM